MATVYKFTPPYFKKVDRKVVVFEPWRVEGAEGVQYLREQLALISKDYPITLDVNGAELSPESIAALFFFALDHQDTHGVLYIKNVGPGCFALLHRMRAHEMPMLQFSVVEAQNGYCLN